MITAKIIADSKVSLEKDFRITTFLLTYPRIIHSELMTHRMFSRNSASSRAIPFEKMVKMVEENPFIPIAWQKDHKGMQGTEYITNEGGNGGDLARIEVGWETAIQNAIEQAKWCNDYGLTKQLCNRLLEPFMWHTVLVTATEWNNFFELRCPKYHTPVSGEGFYFKSKKDCILNHSNPENIAKLEAMSDLDWLQINQSQAEIHIQALAELMWDKINLSVPKVLKSGEYHLPFKYIGNDSLEAQNQIMLKISTARCARLSYNTHDGEIDYEKDIQLHDRLLKDKHMSPFEHCARAMTIEEYYEFSKGQDGQSSHEHGWCDNFKGFISYRHLLTKKH